jgi:2-polyprenyl-6-methoxyphenol hydroxylase-like FAD-dependent oxidoreductase
LRTEGYTVRELRIVDNKGRRVGGFGVQVFRELTGGRYLSIPRSGLAKLIYRKVENKIETIFGDGITHIVPDADGVDVEFEHAPARRFDMVIGADGLHSAVRKLVFGKQSQFEKFLGYTVAAFEIDGYPNLDEGVYVSFSTPGTQIARFALRNDRTLFLLVFASSPPARIEDRATQQESLRSTFGEAGWECRQILSAMEKASDIYFDSVSQIRMEEWWRGRVALIGDAAAAPSLLAGQGAALAMVAAYVLAGELSRAPAPQIAFRRYQDLLRPFLTAKQKAAAQFAGSFAPRSRLGLFLRNQMTRAFAIPYLSTLALGPVIRDRFDLPDYQIARR